MNTKLRCINLDWLEIYCLEPIAKPHDAEYFRACGYKVKERAYGTPQYEQMFTISADGHDLFEVRRKPYSVRTAGGIFEPNACHIRLCNETCYEVDPVAHLRGFMTAHDYEYKAISRIDIALDFNEFDNKMQPGNFIMSYMRGKISKVNQTNVSAHGSDTWSKRIFNSLKWGSPSSPVSTKLYNKTLELKQGEDKPWIRQAWETAGLDTTRNVWRVEFSLSAQMQTLKSLKSGEIFRKSILYYDTRERLLKQFYILYNKYFDFRRVLVNTKSDGSHVYVRKYRCPRLELFKVTELLPYVPVRNVTMRKRPDRIWKIIHNRLEKIQEDEQTDKTTKRAALTILAWCMQRMQLTLSQQRLTDSAMMKELESVYKLTAANIEINYDQREYEQRVMYHLMQKYGITPPDPTLPF